jgi:hypothetical protein
MKNKKTPFLDFYNENIKSGYMPYSGLCSHFELDCLRLIEMFEKRCDIFDESWFWGFDGEVRTYDKMTEAMAYDYERKFTPLRQTIVLFCAAINEEL